jgi:hypothetical protein
VLLLLLLLLLLWVWLLLGRDLQYNIGVNGLWV